MYAYTIRPIHLSLPIFHINSTDSCFSAWDLWPVNIRLIFLYFCTCWCSSCVHSLFTKYLVHSNFSQSDVWPHKTHFGDLSVVTTLLLQKRAGLSFSDQRVCIHIINTNNWTLQGVPPSKMQYSSIPPTVFDLAKVIKCYH